MQAEFTQKGLAGGEAKIILTLDDGESFAKGDGICIEGAGPEGAIYLSKNGGQWCGKKEALLVEGVAKGTSITFSLHAPYVDCLEKKTFLVFLLNAAGEVKAEADLWIKGVKKSALASSSKLVQEEAKTHDEAAEALGKFMASIESAKHVLKSMSFPSLPGEETITPKTCYVARDALIKVKKQMQELAAKRDELGRIVESASQQLKTGPLSKDAGKHMEASKAFDPIRSLCESFDTAMAAKNATLTKLMQRVQAQMAVAEEARAAEAKAAEEKRKAEEAEALRAAEAKAAEEKRKAEEAEALRAAEAKAAEEKRKAEEAEALLREQEDAEKKRLADEAEASLREEEEKRKADNGAPPNQDDLVNQDEIKKIKLADEKRKAEEEAKKREQAEQRRLAEEAESLLREPNEAEKNVPEEVPHPPASQEQAPETKKKGSGFVIAIVAVLCVALLAGGGIYYYMNHVKKGEAPKEQLAKKSSPPPAPEKKAPPKQSVKSQVMTFFAKPERSAKEAMALAQELLKEKLTPEQQDSVFRLFYFAAEEDALGAKYYAKCFDPREPAWGTIKKDAVEAWYSYAKDPQSAGDRAALKQWVEEQARQGNRDCILWLQKMR